MAMTIELKPEQARILQEALSQGRFQSVGQALDEAFHSIEPSGAVRPALSPAERAAAFRSWAASHPRNTPVLSDQAISRETIYSDRG
jgi:predicted nucleic acid-binding protein